jgi:hypothetical protein
MVLASCLVACSGHLTLQAPAANAPEEERLRAYESLRPVDRSMSRESVLSDDPGRPARTTHKTNFVVLGNGQRVEHAEDLLPLVPPDSDMASDARASVGYHRLGTGLIILGVVATAATAFLVFSKDEGERFGPLLYGGSAAGGLLLGSGFAARVQSGHRASRAFTSYDLALRRRLDLCERRGVLSTCKHLPPVEP